MRLKLAFILWIALFTGCYKPHSEAYRQLYAHLDYQTETPTPVCKSDYFLIVFVEARHLDYTDNYSFLKTVAKHPSDGSKNRDVGHAWIYLEGIVDGQKVFVSGGHSGELGIIQARYFDGIMNNIDFGCANPTKADFLCPKIEENPVKYLWEVQRDGFFQCGAGKHRPTYAAKINLTAEQFFRILDFIACYNYRDYAITANQCSSFVAQVASLGGLDLDCEVTMEIQPCLNLKGEKLQLWSDPTYSLLTISSPDILERSLMQAVSEGRAEKFGVRATCRRFPSRRLVGGL